MVRWPRLAVRVCVQIRRDPSGFVPEITFYPDNGGDSWTVRATPDALDALTEEWGLMRSFTEVAPQRDGGA